LVSLGTHIAEPRKRLDHVKAATAAMKATMGSVKSILPTDFPSMGMPWLMEAATALYGKAKVADRIPQVANVVISNVPGPPVPLYMAGAKMITNYPTSIIVHGMGLNITVQSYDKSLDFGLMADASAMPDVRELADAITIAFDDMRLMPRPGELETDDPAPEGLVSKTRRRISVAVKGAVKDAVKGAIGTTAKKLMGAAMDTALAQTKKRVVAKASAKQVAAAPKSAAVKSSAKVRGKTRAVAPIKRTRAR
jgi:diacylglycerol O-acyltransferase / wax synthase